VILRLPTCSVSAWATEPKYTEVELAESQAQSPQAADLMGYKPEESSEQFTVIRTSVVTHRPAGRYFSTSGILEREAVVFPGYFHPQDPRREVTS